MNGPGEGASTDPRRVLLARIVASDHFAKSPKLIHFLEFICEQVLNDHADHINEQSVGNEVFGRPLGYNSNDDNIVRAHASRMRQRLDAYFAAEGRMEPLRIVVPKGSYIPVFCDNPDCIATHLPEPALSSGSASPAPSAERTVVPARPPVLSSRYRYWLVTIACCLVCVAGTLLFLRTPQKTVAVSPAPANHAFWAALFGSTERTLIVPADSSLDIYNNITGQTLSISDYISGGYRVMPDAQSSMTERELHTIVNRRLTSIVDLNIATQILSRPEAAIGQAALIYARDLRMKDLKESSAILIGSQEANPWVQLFDPSLNFSMEADQKTKVFRILNRNPKPGEQPVYLSDPGAPAHLAYALVDGLPNLSGKGYVLILQGTAMAGTEAAADFALGRSDLTKLLHLNSHETIALPKFEVLLQTSNLGGNAPREQIIAYRIYP